MDAIKSADRNKSKRDFRYAESQLRNLNTKIDNLLNKLEEKKQDEAKTPEEECVICVNSKATMQTWPCGHRVVCRKCLVRTIQIAVSRRALPLRCVVCRARVLRLKRSSDHQAYLRHDKGRSHSLPVKLRRRTSAPTLAVRSRSVGPSKSGRLPATVDRRPFNYIRARTGICVDWIDEPTLPAKYKNNRNTIYTIAQNRIQTRYYE
ncbi:uncharacterized protein LOC126902502 isoform X2 [Daktulosphaira vitifoliae]|uniref:uncharacterized protein LOC126902502 isoform X2 n=1 Tax=Daktulosphaira vitifoliae TaxID=58002 RepID=UPI0021AA36A6|nr:uncharacterized protein LOC126902502 isoform X2 [Daktulosphaira vitifoliae]